MIVTELRRALAHPNMQAFVHMLRVGEGTPDEAGFYRLFGGELVTDLSDHPRRAVTRKLAGTPITSTAAGALQFLARTWDECVAALALPDFGPDSQLLAGAYLIRRRRALADVLAGRIGVAIEKCNREWASLPGSPYGQPTVTMARALATYAAAGGQLEALPASTAAPSAADPASTPEQTTDLAPTATTAAPPQENPAMAPILAAFLPALAQRIPEISSLLIDAATIDPKKQRAAQLALDVVTQAVGARNAQEACELVNADPASARAAQEAIRGSWYEIQSASEEAIAAARQTMMELDRRTEVRSVLGRFTFHEVLSLYLVTICAAGAWWVLSSSALGNEIKSAVVTLMIIGGYTGVREFWFGSSHGSKSKDAQRSV